MSILTTVITVIDNARDAEQAGEIGKESTAGVFNGLATTVNVPMFASELDTVERRRAWENSLKPGEDAWCEDNFGAVMEARHAKGKKAGQWKYRTILPNPYTSAKSILGTAIELGINTLGVGKTEIQKAIKKARNGTQVDPLIESTKFVKAIDKARVLYDQCVDPVIKGAMGGYVSDKFDIIKG